MTEPEPARRGAVRSTYAGMPRAGLAACMILAMTAFALSDEKKLDQFEVIFNKPMCRQYFYQSPILDRHIPPQIIYSKPSNVYCTELDLNGESNNNIISAFRNMLKAGPISKIDIAFFAVDDFDFVDLICDAIARNGASLRVVVRADAWGEALDRLQACLKTQGIEWTSEKLKKIGNVGSIGAFHLKIMLIEYKDNTPSVLVFGSGNPAGGVKLYFDNWNIIKTNSQEPIMRKHLCILDKLFIAPEPRSFRSFGQRFSPCFDQAAENDGHSIETFLLPLHRLGLMRTLRSLAMGSTSIDIAIHKVGEAQIRDLLLAALKRGIKVRLIVDDDLFWSSDFDTGFSTNSEYILWLRPILEAGADVRYFQTNHHCRIGNLFHHKFAIFYSLNGPVVLTGGANFTRAAFSGRRFANYENAYLIRNAAAVASYVTAYDGYWNDLATTPEGMPSLDSSDFRTR